MARLDMAQRRALSPSDYVFPEKAPGHGSYPIPDEDHAMAALRFSAGKPEEATVRAHVCAKFKIGCSQK
jgi:hypothetical protein